ncbi:MAG: hypothetical protein JWO38_5840 [Gemmataceae bacterium]|nr:hypothetical protein [Gemmataceae bacterium]
MRVVLVVAEGVHRGREIVAAGPRFIVGRDPDCQLRAKSAAVSKHHFDLTFESDGVWVTDLRSTNGTTVNGMVLGEESVELFDGDRLQAGPLSFVVRIAPAAGTGAGPTVIVSDENTFLSAPPAPIPGGPQDSNPSTAGADGDVERTAEWTAPEEWSVNAADPGSGPDVRSPDKELPPQSGRLGRGRLPPAGPRTARLPRKPPGNLEGTAKAADDLLRRLQRGKKPFPPPPGSGGG